MRAPEFWYPLDGRVTITSFFLSPLSWGYDLAGWLKEKTTFGIEFDIPVICVGNLTAGGTGKTPCCVQIASLVQELSYNPAFVSRGYGGTEKGPLKVDPERHSASDVGDEPLLLAKHAPTWIATHRGEAARAAKKSGVSLILMDDGFQNPSLRKTLSILVVDGQIGFGNRRVIPSGPLRENIKRGLRRADAVVVMGRSSILPPKDQENIVQSERPVFDAMMVPGEPCLHSGIETEDARTLRFVAFAGIGRPQKFFDSLSEVGLDVIEEVPYPDHHGYSARDIDWLEQLAMDKEAHLITTEKDLVRLPRTVRKRVSHLPISVRFNDESGFRQFLREKLL